MVSGRYNCGVRMWIDNQFKILFLCNYIQFFSKIILVSRIQKFKAYQQTMNCLKVQVMNVVNGKGFAIKMFSEMLQNVHLRRCTLDGNKKTMRSFHISLILSKICTPITILIALFLRNLLFLLLSLI